MSKSKEHRLSRRKKEDSVDHGVGRPKRRALGKLSPVREAGKGAVMQKKEVTHKAECRHFTDIISVDIRGL